MAVSQIIVRVDLTLVRNTADHHRRNSVGWHMPQRYAAGEASGVGEAWRDGEAWGDGEAWRDGEARR
jgi:hypothetical protein